MTDIVKVVDAEGAEHWTAEGSPAHEQLVADKEAAERAAAEGLEEVGAGAEGTEVHGDGDDHDATGSGGEPGDGEDDASAAARRQ